MFHVAINIIEEFIYKIKKEWYIGTSKVILNKYLPHVTFSLLNSNNLTL